jgi:HEAT repeat protein
MARGERGGRRAGGSLGAGVVGSLDGPTQEWIFRVVVVIVAALFVVTAVFAAYVFLLRLRNEARDRQRAGYTAKWQDRLLQALGDDDAARALTASVAEGERLHFVGFAVQFARRLRGGEREALGRLVKPFLGPIVERADARHIEIRARAIQTLGTLGLPDHAARVIAALDDESSLVAMVAARALALGGEPEYAQAVLARFHRFTGWNRRFLASLLASMGSSVAATLRSALADPSTESRARAVAAEALQIQGDIDAGDVAAEVLRTAQDREVVATSLRLLRKVGRPEHADGVRMHVGSKDPVVRAHALHALGVVGGEAEIPQLVEAMRDPSPWAALNATEGLLAAGGAALLSRMAASGDAVGVLARQVLATRSH